MTRKAMFFSLSAIFLILFLFILFSNKAEIIKINQEFHINRAQITVMDHFVRDFDRYYIKQILETSAKQALAKRTKASVPFAKEELVDVMVDGEAAGITYLNPVLTTDSNFGQALKTLTFKIDKNNRKFQYSLQNVKQVSYNTVQLDFLVEYMFVVSNINWSQSDDLVSINISIYSLWHPSYSDYIDETWVANDTGCYVNEIIISPLPCIGLNIMPPT